MALKVRPASRRGPPHSSSDPKMAEGGNDGGRRMEEYNDGYSARLGDHSPYTKGNFQFERIVTGWRAKHAPLDLRLKK